MYTLSNDCYDSWRTDNSDLYDHSPSCRKCDEKEKTLKEAADWLTEIVKLLYTKENLSIHNLEHCLDELCYLLDVTPNTGDIQIERTRSSENQKLDLYLAYTDMHKFANQLTKSQQ